MLEGAAISGWFPKLQISVAAAGSGRNSAQSLVHCPYTECRWTRLP